MGIEAKSTLGRRFQRLGFSPRILHKNALKMLTETFGVFIGLAIIKTLGVRPEIYRFIQQLFMGAFIKFENLNNIQNLNLFSNYNYYLLIIYNKFVLLFKFFYYKNKI